MLFINAAFAEERFISVQELRTQAPERWIGLYETKWRDVAIDARVYIPEVENVPVMLVKGGMETYSADEEKNWDSIKSKANYVFSLSREGMPYPKKVNGKKLNQNLEASETWTSNVDPHQAYVPMSKTTLSEIGDQIESELLRYGFVPQEYSFRTPYCMRAQHMYYWGYKQDALPGELYLDSRYMLSGIPVYSHILNAVSDHKNGESRVDEFSENPYSYAVYCGHGEELTALSLWRVEPKEVLAKDVPLCSFEKAIDAVELEIQNGHVRKVFEIELGYILYNQPGVYHSQKMALVEGTNTQSELESAKRKGDEERSRSCYYVKPMWIVNCLYVDNPQGKLRDFSSYSNDERNTLDYRQLFVDAQTGELIGTSRADDRCEFKGFISWEEVD